MHTDITIEDERWNEDAAIADLVRRAVETALAEAKPGAAGAQVSVLLGDDARLRTLNRTFRGQDKPTNVLSFPAAAAPGQRLLGDIALAYDTVAREARDERKRLADHAAHLAVHGLLHLVGHDHDEEQAAVRMETLERRILARLGIADPYAANDDILETADSIPR